jgi:hypothetical protein
VPTADLFVSSGLVHAVYILHCFLCVGLEMCSGSFIGVALFSIAHARMVAAGDSQSDAQSSGVRQNMLPSEIVAAAGEHYLRVVGGWTEFSGDSDAAVLSRFEVMTGRDKGFVFAQLTIFVNVIWLCFYHTVVAVRSRCTDSSSIRQTGCLTVAICGRSQRIKTTGLTSQ